MIWEVRADPVLAQGVKKRVEGMMMRGAKWKIGHAKRGVTRRMSLDVKGW
jgi:hypothetical protein